MRNKVGWIRLYRKVFDNDLWNREMFSKCQAWIDLLLMAEFEPKVEIKRYQELRIERGEVLTTIRELSERWKWSRTKVVNFINALEGCEMVTQKVTSVGTVITIENYSIYQGDSEDKETRKETAKRQPKDSRKTLTSYKEYKEDKKIINNSARTRARTRVRIPPNLDEVKAYIAEKGYSVDAEHWYDFYQSKGWYIGKNKMKDWKAAVRTWAKNDKRQDKPPRNEVLEMMREGVFDDKAGDG